MKSLPLKRNSLDLFFEGFARTIDIAGSLPGRNLFKVKPTPVKSDREALTEDWQSVGDDIRYALEQMKSPS